MEPGPCHRPITSYFLHFNVQCFKTLCRWLEARWRASLWKPHPLMGATSQGSTTMGFIHAASSVSVCCVGGRGGQACRTDNASCWPFGSLQCVHFSEYCLFIFTTFILHCWLKQSYIKSLPRQARSSAEMEEAVHIYIYMSMLGCVEGLSHPKLWL